MNNSASKIKLTDYDDLFGFKEEKKDEQIKKVDINKIVSFKNHPFKVIENDDFNELVKSINEIGIMEPLKVREIDGRYEIISGHRRKKACEILGITEIPVEIKDVDDDDAVIMMVDANIHRANILPSEKAKSYKMKNDALKHKGKKSIMNTAEKISENDSERQVFRYIRLTNLIPELLDLTDEGKLSFGAAVSLSYLSEDGQKEIMNYYEITGNLPNADAAEKLKNISSEVNFDEIQKVMIKPKTNKRKVSFSENKLKEFFTDDVDENQIEEIIMNLLKNWKMNETNNN